MNGLDPIAALPDLAVARSVESMWTSDGVRLDADVWRPASDGSFPVLLLRQAYGRRIASTLCYAHPAWYAAQGFVVVVQDVRGRGTSEGAFDPLVHEGADGASAIGWAAGLAGSNGAVGTYGFSYQGTNQLLAAAQAGPELRAMAPAMIGWNLRADWAFEGGGFNLAGNLGWALQLEAETARIAGDRERHARLRAAAQAGPSMEAAAAWPSVARDELAGSFYARWLADDEAMWTALSPATHTEALVARGTPALFVGGWHDSHLPGTIAGYRALAGAGARLIVGPWGHFPWDRRVGALDYGALAVSDIDLQQVAFFRHHLGMGSAAPAGAPVRLFDLGAQCWRNYDGWPNGAEVALYPASTGRAAIDIADGRLVSEPPGGATDYVVHDPWRPAPAVGGAYGAPGGPADRDLIDNRSDVLTFTTAPLDADMMIAGDIAVELAMTADVAVFDLSVTLSHIVGQGAARAVSTGYLAMIPADGGKVRIGLRPTCLTVKAGERLRLSLAASAWPAHPVNPGTGQNPALAYAADALVTTLTLTHGGADVSRLLLSLSPGEAPC